MTPYISLAEEIEVLKPDLKDFWETIQSNNYRTTFKQLLRLPFSASDIYGVMLSFFVI